MKDLTTLQEFTSPARLQRLANKAVNNLGLSLVDVTVEPRDGGQVAIVLPDAWAYLFLAHLEATAKQVTEQLRKAMYAAKMKDGRIQAQLQEAAAAWEKRRLSIRARYAELIEGGLSKRDCIRQIKAESAGDLSATEIAAVIGRWDPRKQKQREAQRETEQAQRRKADKTQVLEARTQRKADRSARNARILALRAQKMTLQAIAREVGTSLYTVHCAVKGGRNAKADGG